MSRRQAVLAVADLPLAALLSAAFLLAQRAFIKSLRRLRPAGVRRRSLCGEAFFAGCRAEEEVLGPSCPARFSAQRLRAASPIRFRPSGLMRLGAEAVEFAVCDDTAG